MDDLSNAALYLGQGAGAAVVVGLVEGLKRTLPSLAWDRLAPGAAILLALAWNALVLAQLGLPVQPITVVFLGVITGLSASGLFSGIRNTTGAGK